MNYRKLQIEDRERFYTELCAAPWMNGYVNSELVFENLWPWTETDGIEIRWTDRYGLIRCNRLGAKSYFPPIAATLEAFQEAIVDLLREESSPLMVGLTEPMLSMLPKQGVILEDDVLGEYIYSTKELAELKGGKFHRRRNLFSQFAKTYQHHLVTYDPSRREAVVDLLDRYLAQGGDDADRKALLAALEASDTLPIDGLLLYVEERLCALSVSTITPYHAGVVLFEKADVEYIGAYTAVAKFAASSVLSSISEVSRQEDLGLPHLRKAKLANQPLRKERKYAWLADSTMAGLHALYEECFPEDSRPYIDYVFLNQTSINHAHAIVEDGRVIAGLHALPRRLVYQDRTWSCDTIVGASVSFAMRGRGLMKQLLAEAIQDAVRREIAFVTLSPVSSQIYRSSGFVPYATFAPLGKQAPATPVELEQTVNVATLMRLFAIAVHGKTLWHVRDEARWYDWMNALWQDKYVVSLIKRDGAPIGYVAHRDTQIEELALIEDVLPVIAGLDFTTALVPSKEGTPLHMIRIAHLPTFWSNLTVNPTLDETVRIRFVDPIVAQNNKDFELSAINGLVSARECDQADHVIPIDELAEIAFLGKQDSVLSSWFVSHPTITYDRY